MYLFYSFLFCGFMGMFDLTATGISADIIFLFIFTLIFKPRN